MQSGGFFVPGDGGKLAETGVAKTFSTVFFSLAFVCIGLDTRLKEIVSKENRNLLRSFLAAQGFNIVVTFVIACLLFGVLEAHVDGIGAPLLREMKVESAGDGAFRTDRRNVGAVAEHSWNARTCRTYCR